MPKKNKKTGKLVAIFKHLKHSAVSLHHMVWGPGWKRFLIALGVTFVIVTAIMIASIELTSHPKFCNTCHLMKPYYESWKTSSHKHVTCTDCHFPPGIKNKLKGKFTALSMLVNYMTGIYKRSKPLAEISDASCMRSGCHETRLLQGEVVFKKNIRFDHGPHLKTLRRGKKLRCTSCHSQIVQGSHISVTGSTCFLCHFKEADGKKTLNSDCTMCHEPPTAKNWGDTPPKYDHTSVTARNIACQKCHGVMATGDGAVPRMRCGMCHADVEKIKKYDDTELMHINHIAKHKIECDRCHTEIQHHSVARSKEVKPDCTSCHPDFHNAQYLLFSGQGGKGIPAHPSAMYESGLTCQACHIVHQSSDEFQPKGEVMRAGAQSCDPCHGKGYQKLLGQWKTQMNRKLSQLSGVLGTAKRIIETRKSNRGYAGALKFFKDAEYNYKLVKHGNPVHNIAFASKLMDKSRQFAQKGLDAVNSKAKLPYYESETNLVPGECSNCHVGVERVQKNVFGWKFSHFNHLGKQGLTCNRCHSHQRTHGELIIVKKDCMNCHHPADADHSAYDCKTCHIIQQEMYTGKTNFSTFKIPNVMVEDIGCTECHLDDNDKLFRPDKKVCTKCHEEDYEEMFVEWKTTTLDLLKQLRKKVTANKLRKGHPAYDTLRILEKDGSKGIHNPELYEKLVEEALKK